MGEYLTTITNFSLVSRRDCLWEKIPEIGTFLRALDDALDDKSMYDANRFFKKYRLRG